MTDVYIIGEIGWEASLQNLIEQVNQLDEGEQVNLKISSPGGNLDQGLAMYHFLKKSGREIHAESLGLVASAATFPFLAASPENRVINEGDNFLIHLPMSWADGNSDEMQEQIDDLRRYESKMAKIYSSETSLTEEEAIEMMKMDKSLDMSVLVDKGFVNQIKELVISNNLFTMSKEDKGIINAITEGFAQIKAKLGGEVKNSIMLRTSEQIEVTFPDLEEGQTPSVGDSATVDGSPAEGTHLMPDGNTFVFSEGSLSEIIEAESEEGSEEEGAEASVDEETKAKVDVNAENIEAILKSQKETVDTIGLIAAKLDQFEAINKTIGEIKGELKGQERGTKKAEEESVSSAIAKLKEKYK